MNPFYTLKHVNAFSKRMYSVLSVLLTVCLFSVGLHAQDLELSMSISPSDPNIYETTSITLTLNNTGDAAASGILVEIPEPDGVVYEGGNEFTVSQGAFVPFGGDVWSVGNIAAGSSATMTVNYFMLTALPVTVYAQVTAADGTDADSTPGNGVSPSANEDDEAVGSINGSISNPCTGDLTINTQADLNDFPSSCTVWDGSLLILGTNISDLSPLSNLQQVTGDLHIADAPNLTDLKGLESLTSTGGSLMFTTNENLSSVSALSNVQSVGGRLQFTLCNSLGSLDGVQNVSSVVQLWITSNNQLSDCCAVYNLIDNGGVQNNIVINNNPMGCSGEADILASCGGQDICPGDVELTSQAEVNAWAGCAVVEGNLRIAGNDITDLSPLTSLQKVRGLLSIDDNLILTNLSGLENVDSVAALIIAENAALTSVNVLDLSQNDIASIVFYNNDNLFSIGGFNSLSNSDNIEILNNDALISITGFNNLQTVKGKIHVHFHSSLTEVSGFQNLKSVDQNLHFLGNDVLEQITGFGNLTTVGAIFLFNSNNGLKTLNGFNSLSNLKDIVFAGNTALEEINALSSVTSISGNLTIINNPLLSDCCGVYPMLNSGGVAGIVDINNNPMPCSSDQNVLDNCIQSGDIDLELSLSQPNANPDQWTSYSITATLSNTGGQTATGVKLQFPKPSGVVYTGGNEYTVSQGDFQPFGVEEWNVGSIPAGGAVTMTVNYFLTAASAPTAYAQVTAANENDGDSTPGNGTPPTPNEDDEASTTGGGGQPDLIPQNLSLSTTSVSPGGTFGILFEAVNIGSPLQQGQLPFQAQLYLSTNNTLGGSDIKIGGPVTLGLGTATTGGIIPSGFAAGQYFAIIKMDDANEISESNESNNVAVAAQKVTVISNGGGPSCGFITYYDAANINNLSPGPEWILEEDANGYSIFNSQSKFELDLEGNVLSDAEVLPMPTGYDVSVEEGINDNVVMVFNQSPDLPTGTIVPIDIGLANLESINSVGTVIKTINGFAFQLGVITGPPSAFNNLIIQTDNVGQNVRVVEFTDTDFFGNTARFIEGTDGSLYTEWRTAGNYSLFVIPADGSTPWQAGVGADTPSTTWVETEGSLDGNFVYTMKTDNWQTFVAKYNVSTGNLVGIDLVDLKTSAVPGGFRNTWAVGIEPTADGGLLVSLSARENVGIGPDYFVLAKYDASDNLVWKTEIPQIGFEVTPLGETSDGGALFGGSSNVNNPNGVKSLFIKVTADGQLTPDCSNGGGNQPDLTLADLKIENSPINAGQVLTYNFDAANNGNANATGDFTIKGYISSDANLSNDDIQDGTIMTGNYGAGNVINNVPGASTISANLAAGQYYLILKIDADNQIGESNENNNTVAQLFTVNGGGGDPCDNITVTTGNGELTVSNVSAAHVIIKVFAPNWATVFDCLDNSCNNPQYVGGLNGGTHYVSVKLLDSGWQEICKYEEFIDVPNPVNGGGGNFLSVPDFLGRPVRLLGIQPNPAFHGETTAVILSNEEGWFDLDVYDVFGRKAISQKIELEKGRNEIRLDISDFRDGTYYLNMPGHNWRHMPVRFVVTRW